MLRPYEQRRDALVAPASSRRFYFAASESQKSRQDAGATRAARRIASRSPSMFAGHDVSCPYNGNCKSANREIAFPGKATPPAGCRRYKSCEAGERMSKNIEA